jgi:hypothetical protein
MAQSVDIINYDVINFHPDTGVLELYIHELQSNISVEVPIIDGKFLTGDELIHYIAGFIPVHSIQRKRELANVTNADEFKQFIKETSNNASLAKAIRIQRDALLLQSDWLVLPDAGITNEALQRFLKYRQSLRDVPQQPGFPFDVKWPEVTGEWVNHPEAKQYDDFSDKN